MAALVQVCKGADAAEDDDRERHRGGSLLPMTWSIASEFIQRIVVFERAEPGQTTRVQRRSRPRHHSQA
jgi:hypothetical protein